MAQQSPFHQMGKQPQHPTLYSDAFDFGKNQNIAKPELQNVKFFTQINFFQMNLPQEKARIS